MRPGMKLYGDQFIAQRPRVVMGRVWAHHNRLAHHCRTEGNDLRSLLALKGPPDLSFFSSPIDGHLGFLEGYMAQDRIHLFRVFRMRHYTARTGSDKLHIDPFSLE